MLCVCCIPVERVCKNRLDENIGRITWRTCCVVNVKNQLVMHVLSFHLNIKYWCKSVIILRGHL